MYLIQEVMTTMVDQHWRSYMVLRLSGTAIVIFHFFDIYPRVSIIDITQLCKSKYISFLQYNLNKEYCHILGKGKSKLLFLQTALLGSC